MKSWFVLLFILINCLVLFAQEHRLSTSIGVTRYDYFHSIDYSIKNKKLEASAGAGYGINRSYFQQRFFPKLQLLVGYNFFQQPKFEFGPSFYTSFSWLKINKLSDRFTNWNEFFGGFSWSYGRNWKIGQTICAGYFTESFFSTLLNERDRVGNWGYYINLKLIHVF